MAYKIQGKAIIRMSKKVYPTDFEALLSLQDVPVVAIDQESLFTFVNEAFEKEYGWSGDELIGKPVTEIMPQHMRSAHNVGFARFLTTESSKLLGTPLPLQVRYKDGKIKVSNHFILGDKQGDSWRFAAIIDYPKTDAEQA